MTDFETLYDRYAADVFRFALYLAGNRDDASDLTSETFVRLWAAPGEIRMNTVKGYLLTITRNLYLQSLRRTRRQVELDESLGDPAPGPQALAERAAEISLAIEGLQRLPEIDRAALILRAVEELSYDEIARTLGLTLAATKVKIHRARRSLLEQRDPPGDEKGART